MERKFLISKDSRTGAGECLGIVCHEKMLTITHGQSLAADGGRNNGYPHSHRLQNLYPHAPSRQKRDRQGTSTRPERCYIGNIAMQVYTCLALGQHLQSMRWSLPHYII